ncbi:hypothetical protein ADN00_12080 [Ornatilinea apprima]|uniref:Capsule biosynthesis protein n=1 Tax=Ornatilinea apprima TaxID=1134406 RepID=A0A0P6X924_9CHLR|nr:hypothetical protein [Ornatilinea apprima]KPL76076.1 hypothetical protein ADN00_12080 [Ornatilinea apprima]
MTATTKETLKTILGEMPFTAELYWLFRQRGKPLKSRFSLKNLQSNLPQMVQTAAALRESAPQGKKVFVFATLHYWIEHAAALGITLAGQGHEVTLGFIPHSDWQKPINRFDLRRQNAYARKVLELAHPVMKTISFMNVRTSSRGLPEKMMEAVRQVSEYDTQYTLQVEEADPESEIYKIRYERNLEAAQIGMAVLRHIKPDVVIIPNGTIMELGVIYRLAKFMGIDVVTYEFGDQRQRIWVGQNREIMRQETDDLWTARSEEQLTDAQLQKVRDMFAARQRADLWQNFSRLWQDTPVQGGEKVRAQLGLDQRPIVLLATNVLGDSLTLGRQVFSQSMSNWISRTVQYFIGRPDVQLVIRVHPGELLIHGQSMVDVVKNLSPELPEHIHLIGPSEKINTYDLVEVADLGLVYTTTVGLEMAMSGRPVIVAGQTHYRERGFTHDPDSWVNYFKMVGRILREPKASRLTREQVEKAWAYAYRFFFEFPRPFPWHLVRMWEDYEKRSIADVLSPAGLETYGQTLSYLVGEPMDWSQIKEVKEE